MADFKELIDHALARVPDATRISIMLDGQGKVTIERQNPASIGVFSSAAAPVYAGATAAAHELSGGAPPSGDLIKAPLVGMFYTAPAPDAAPFVTVGRRVKKGDTLCIIEAMKLMNEIESTYDGVIEAILAENGAMVEFGQPLFAIKTE